MLSINTTRIDRQKEEKFGGPEKNKIKSQTNRGLIFSILHMANRGNTAYNS